LAANGISVVLNDTFISTPAISSGVVDLKCDAGVIISASHNPPEFNGFKIKIDKGCSAPGEMTSEIERLMGARSSNDVRIPGNVQRLDLTQNYFDRLKSFVDFSLLKKSNIKIVADPMHGASCTYMERLLKSSNIRLATIHNNPDPVFGGMHPEPIESELGELKKTVRMSCADVGLATDGDGDRIGVVDEKGRYYSPHQVFPLLLYYMSKYRKERGKVVQTISLGYLSERMAKDNNLEWEEVPIGFKYIADRIIKEKVLIGGEESGGYGYGSFLPERDGILNSLMIAEMLSVVKKPMSKILEEIEALYGKSVFLRADFKKSAKAIWSKSEFVDILKAKSPDKIAGLRVKVVKDYDGIEFVLEDDSWILMRPSGTEPIIRVYCESPALEKTKKIINWGNNFVSSLV
jgi:phosphomannomutase